MKAVVLTSYGEPVSGLEYREVPEPEKPGVGQVLVGIEFSPINFTSSLPAAFIRCVLNCLPSSATKGWGEF